MANQRPGLNRALSSPENPYSGSAPPSMSRNRSQSPNRLARKPVPSFVPPIPALPQDDRPTLNFHRRPSTAYDLSSSRSRDLTASMGPAGEILSPPTNTHQLPPPRSSPSPASSPAPRSSPSPSLEHHRRRSSHTRQPSISLSSSNINNSILPPHPVPTRTRAPIESFASVDMLQGQREFQERRRGSEVFSSETGRYEGRAVPGLAKTESMYSTRRVDPNEHVRQARNSQRLTSGAPTLPPIDVDLGNIATQLREHDSRRGSEDKSWHSVNTGTEAQEGISPTSASAAVDFSFPQRPTSSRPYILDVSSDDSSISDDGTDLGDEKSYDMIYGTSEKPNPSRFSSSTLGSTTKEKAGFKVKSSSWRTEILGDGAGGMSGGFGASHRPSIVALPVYPAPSGSLNKSWKYKKNMKKIGYGFSWVTLAASLGATGVYLFRRAEGMAAVEARIPGKFWTAWMFLAIEFLVAFIVGIQAIWDVATFRFSSGKPKLRLRGDKNLPAVDVFIVSAGQPDQTTFDCAITAASMDYPAHRFRVMVLDPTGSAILERDIQKHAKSQGCPHLTYHRRILNNKDVAHNAKASSINFGMKEASTFGIKGPGEFIVVLDADVLVERNFLRAALPAILTDAKVAVVKTGHGFVNLPSRLTQANATLMASTERPSEARSGFVLRRSAITEIGGFPTDSWLQDGHAEALLEGRGYSTAVVEEVLQWGFVKSTYGAQIDQMMINRIGPLRTAARLGFFLRGDRIALMSTWSRVKALGRAFNPIFSLIVLALTIGYPLMFSYGGLLVLTPNLATLNVLLQSVLIMVTIASLHDLVWTWSTGVASPRRKFQAWVFTAPYEAVALLRLILPSWLGGYHRGSDIDINPAVGDGVRPSFWKRVGRMALDPHSGVLFAFAGSIAVTIWRAARDHAKADVDVHQTALTVLLTVGWPSMIWIDILYGSLVPYFCLLFPSRRLSERREVFLIRDTYSSIAHPKHSYKTAQPFKVYRTPQFITAFLIIGWSTACLAVGLATTLLA